jgi:beta-lactam-binding protein with PASTA domain
MSITIYYSSGPDVAEIEVPTVTGLTEQQAKLRLDGYNLSYDTEEVYSDEYPEGYVIYQSIPAGESVPIHTKIILQISLGPEKSTSTDLPTTPASPDTGTQQPDNQGQQSDNAETGTVGNNGDTEQETTTTGNSEDNAETEGDELGSEEEGIKPNG